MATWKGLVHQPSFNASTMLLLTDGRIMVQEDGTNHWHALSPDEKGSYRHGKWHKLASMLFYRRYFASGILKDGRVIICGGEDSNGGGDTNKCEIYNPITDSWTVIPSPENWTNVGDASSCVLPDGRFMIGNINDTECAIYDPVVNKWEKTGSKEVRSNEETWILMPDNTILTLQCFDPYNSEKYNIATGQWRNEGPLALQETVEDNNGIMHESIVDQAMSEIGPAMLMPNRKVIYFGANGLSGVGKTAIYTPPGSPDGYGIWEMGPDIPNEAGKVLISNDCPATLLPSGKVLFTTGLFSDNTGVPEANWIWPTGVYCFEYDPHTNSINPIASPPNTNAGSYLFQSRMLLLPNGEVMYSNTGTDIQLYDGGGIPDNAWRPEIISITPVHIGHFIDYFELKGIRLNGLSQANIYGDDCANATNYPLVMLKANNGDESYCRTFNFSTMGVATGSNVESCNFTVPPNHYGHYELYVIANGIKSPLHHLYIPAL